MIGVLTNQREDQVASVDGQHEHILLYSKKSLCGLVLQSSLSVPEGEKVHFHNVL